MQNTNKLKEKINILNILNYYKFEQINECENQIRACCKIHSGDNPSAFVWNKETNLWYCHTNACGGGDVFDLIMKLENTSFKEALIKIQKITNITLEDEEINLISFEHEENKKWIKKMKETSETVELRQHAILTPQKDQMFYRFERQTLCDFNATLCNKVELYNKKYYNKLTIPIWHNNIIKAYALRSLDEKTPKWLFAPKETRIGRLLYNFDKANEMIVSHKANDIILVEGIFDVWRYKEAGINNCCAVFGSSLTKTQQQLLLKTGAEITLSFDNDDAGNKCTKETIEMFKNKTNIKTVELPNGKDPADLSKEELHYFYKNKF